MTSQGRKTRNSPQSRATLTVNLHSDENERQALARNLAGPFARHGLLAEIAAGRVLHGLETQHKPELLEFTRALKERSDRAATGDKSQASALLFAQALSLDAIYTEYARIALRNIEKGDATERYLRLALRAQTASRAALEAHGKLHQPRTQTVRHVHVTDGGQAVIAGEIHHHAGAKEGNVDKQPHAQGPRSPTLPSNDAERPSLLSACDPRQSQMPDARRKR